MIRAVKEPADPGLHSPFLDWQPADPNQRGIKGDSPL